MNRVPLSALGNTSPDDFDAVVQRHAADLRAHKNHHAARDAAIAALAPDDNGASIKHQPYPPPWAPAIVDACVRRPDMVVDYEILNDGPKPAEKLRWAKDAAITRVADWEVEKLKPLFLPPGKQRMHILKLSENDPEALALQEEIDKKTRPIMRKSATACAEIEDLADIEAVEKWEREWNPD